MSLDRDLTTSRQQVFGDVEPGTECRICGRDVDDGRSKTCSEYCDNLQQALMGLLNWSSVRRRIIGRDDETCQRCGYDRSRDRLAARHIRDRVDELCGPRPDGPGLAGAREADDETWERYFRRKEAWRECRERMRARYGNPWELGRDLEVDHITPVADGGHPFDPANLQTLCAECHREKTAAENSERGQTPSRGDLSRSLLEFVADGGDGR